ncbi:MAG TPA: sigma-70 family RNA polymerase sigma factor, partial [Telluria sp.]|nr:sigma-70 family RNA polymerase sigma factor [Telluria sp.]
EAQPIMQASPPRRQERDAVDALWTCFVASRDAAAREQLVATYLEFARILAAKMYRGRTYTEMEFGDYLQYARIGLVEAIDRFEPERGFKFETFAASRINGAMLNGIATSSEIQQQIAARRRTLTQRLGTLQEGAETPVGADAVFARLAELALDLAVGFALEDSGMDASGAYPDNSYHGVEMKQLRARVHGALAALPERQRMLLHGHYLQQQSFADLADGMGLTRGRVAQLHKEALGNLRARLQDLQDVDLRC